MSKFLLLLQHVVHKVVSGLAVVASLDSFLDSIFAVVHQLMPIAHDTDRRGQSEADLHEPWNSAEKTH